MKTKLSIHLLSSIILATTLAGIPAAYAWKPSTHIFLAEEVLKDALDGNVSICRTDYVMKRVLKDCKEYAVDAEILASLRAHPQQYRAGVLGPDAYPDILTGQRVIHPDTSLPKKPKLPGGTNSWLQYLWDNANGQTQNRLSIKAFTAGYLTHAAGDMFGHTFVNHFSGGEFELGQNAVKHIVLEGYVGKRTPTTVDATGVPVTENSISIADGVSDFIYRYMIDAKPDSFLDTDLLVGSGANTSVPRIYSDLRTKLQRNVDDYYAKKADYDRRYDEKIKAAKACRVLDFSCSKTVLYAQAAAIQTEKAAYVTANGLQVTYKEHWVEDIDSGLKAWPATSHELAKALIFNSNGADTDRAQQVAQQYVTNHLLSMAGAPDALGATVEFVDRVLQALLPQVVRDAVNQMKRDLLSYLLENSFGFTVEQLKAYLNNPESSFDSVLNTGTSTQKTTLQKFNRDELKINDTGFSNPQNPERFDYKNVPAAYNTVTISKMVLLGRDEMNRLLSDLGSSTRLNAPNSNIMLGFIRTLDGDNEWHDNAPYKLALALECNAYTKVFMSQTGEQGGCADSVSAVMVLNRIATFNGTSDFVEISNDDKLNFGTGDLSISAWVKTTSNNGIAIILDKRVEASGPIQGYSLVSNSGTLLLQLADGEGTQFTNYVSNILIADGNLHHVAVTVDRDQPDGGRWYIDGIEVIGERFNPTRTGSLSNSKPLVIGRRSDNSGWPGFFNGEIGPVIVASRVLSSQEIQAIVANKP